MMRDAFVCLLQEVNSAKDFLETRLVSQRSENGINSDPHQVNRPCSEGLLKL
jgi:hypothetical protein